MSDVHQIKDTETRRELLKRSAPVLAQYSLATLLALGCDALASMAKRTRKDSIYALYLLTPVITAQGGQDGAAEVFRAMRDAARWWP